jgi:hypothetical protein
MPTSHSMCRTVIARFVAALALMLSTMHPAVAYDGPPVPDPTDLVELVRKSVLAVDAGNKSGQYTALHDMGSTAFKQAYDLAALNRSFSELRSAALDLAIVKDKVPLTSRPPTLDRNGRLRILGYFELPPNQLVYDVLYDFDTGQKLWKIASISVKSRPLPEQPELLQPRN